MKKDKQLDVLLSYDNGFALKLCRLLHVSTGAKQTADGAYAGRIFIGPETLLAHLNGDITVAVNAVRSRRSVNFICIDIDDDFHQRLPIAKGALRSLNLADSSFATNGSSFGRGKVIVALCRPMPRHQGDQMRDLLVARLFEHGMDINDKIDIFPTGGQGGLVRVLGRNGVRNGPIEVPLNLDGAVSDLSYVQPHSFKTEPAPIVAKLIEVSPWVVKTLENGLSRQLAHKVILRRLRDCARDAIRLAGPDARDAAWSIFATWLSRIRQRSSTITDDTTKSELFNTDTEALRIFNYAFNASWKPIHLIEGTNSRAHCPCYIRISFRNPAAVFDIPRGGKLHTLTATPASKSYTYAAGKLYQTLTKWVHANGLSPRCFSIDSDRVAWLLGYSQTRAYKVLQDAINQELLIKLDAGSRHLPNSAGRPATYALVGRDDVDLAAAKLRSMTIYEARKRRDAQRREQQTNV